jgi:hypothetical protein
MEQIVTGVVQGTTIVLNEPLSGLNGRVVEVVVRDVPAKQGEPTQANGEGARSGVQWTDEDDRIFEEIYRQRKLSTRPEIVE